MSRFGGRVAVARGSGTAGCRKWPRRAIATVARIDEEAGSVAPVARERERVLLRRVVGAWFMAGLWTTCAAAAPGDSYLRAGIGLDRPAETVFSDRDCASVSPAALYGCGRGGDGAPNRSVGDFGTPEALEIGLGRVATRTLRFEVLAGYRPRLEFRGRANFLEPMREQAVEAQVSSLSALLAVHVDLPAVGVPRVGPLEPFVGVGAGVVRTRVGETTMKFPRTTTTVPGADRTEFAWMITAGVAAVLNARATLELAWRYSDLGEVRTGRGAGRVVWRDGSREPLPLDLAATSATLRSHGLRLSLRYAF